MKVPGWFYAWAAIGLVLWVVVAVVAYHFIAKWW